jgi:drug/metabolite transporter (DMT)-like permease
VTRSYPVLIGFLAAVWGSSYLFIKIAVDEIEPAPMMWIRVVLASALLVPFLVAREGAAPAFGHLRGAWKAGLILGLVNAAVPFTLIAWGEKHIDSGVAAIANATVPIFVVLLAIRFRPSERVTGGRLAGFLAGFVGVAVLAGGGPEDSLWGVAGTLAVVLASLAYAVGALYGGARTGDTSGPVLATASMLGACLWLLPLAVVQMPTDMPSWGALASVAFLGVMGTAVAQLVLFRSFLLHGSAKTTLVTYLMPPTALVYGALLLDEPVTAAAIGGLALILGGVALGSGALRLPRRAPVTQTP